MTDSGDGSRKSRESPKLMLAVLAALLVLAIVHDARLERLPNAYEAKLDSTQSYAWINDLASEDAIALIDQAAARNVACSGANALRGDLRERSSLLCGALTRALPEGERVLRSRLRPAYTFAVFDGAEQVRVGPFEDREACEKARARLSAGPCVLW